MDDGPVSVGGEDAVRGRWRRRRRGAGGAGERASRSLDDPWREGGERRSRRVSPAVLLVRRGALAAMASREGAGARLVTVSGGGYIAGPGSNRFAGVIQLVECQLPKLDVAGSSPVARSLFHNELADLRKRLMVSG